MTRTMRPTSTKRENLCGDGCDASFAGSSGRLAGASSVSVAGGLRALLAGSQHCQWSHSSHQADCGRASAHLHHPRWQGALLVAGPPASRNRSRGLSSHQPCVVDAALLPHGCPPRRIARIAAMPSCESDANQTSFLAALEAVVVSPKRAQSDSGVFETRLASVLMY